MSEPIVAYCSHSYRPEDRAVNMAVWDRLNKAGLVFAVDPPSQDKRPMDVTFLERMMQRSDCFVAIVPDRSLAVPAQEGITGRGAAWSPYQDFECRLALRQDKPRLVVVEQGIDYGPLSEDRSVMWFQRANLTLSPGFDVEVEQLITRAAARLQRKALMPKVGLLRWEPAHEAWRELTAGVREELGNNCEIVEVDAQTLDHLVLARTRELSLVVADLNPSVTPAYLIGMLHGAGVPLYRTCLCEPDANPAVWAQGFGLPVGDTMPRPATAAQSVLPRLLTGYKLDARMQPVHFWTRPTLSDSIQTIVKAIDDYRDRERRLDRPRSGRDYFLNLHGNRVFISTPSDLNTISQLVKVALEDAGMPAFHYQLDRMEGGKVWKSQLEARIRASDLFLGFVSDSYWDRDECVDEMALAVARWEQHEMLIVLYGSDPLPPLPPFLRRAQVNRIGQPEETVQRVVGEVSQRFIDGAQEPAEKVTQLLTDLARRHVPLSSPDGLASWLRRVCCLKEMDAQRVCTRVFDAGALDSARELVISLLTTIPVERFGGSALGRLCLHFRSLESSRSTRAQLSRSFSQLRLFPKLHDVYAWNRQRKRRQVNLRLTPTAPGALLEVLTRTSAELADPLSVVRQLGDELARYVKVDDSELLLAQPETRVCILSGAEHLASPLEWVVLKGLAEPLARARTVFRRVEDLHPVSRRANLEFQFHDGQTGPPRVLLFGHATPSLQHVTTELEALENLLSTRYRSLGWPEELIKRVSPGEATRDQLEALLAGSDYEIVHLAGHAGFEGGRPVMQVAAADGRSARVTGEELSAWLRTSTVRFVFLSCCQGAASDPDWQSAAGWRQSLCKEMLEGGVPEVLAHIWDVGDIGSVAFSSAFYDAYVPAFDAPAALYAARQSSSRGDSVWASSILVQQDWRDREP